MTIDVYYLENILECLKFAHNIEQFEEESDKNLLKQEIEKVILQTEKIIQDEHKRQQRIIAQKGKIKSLEKMKNQSKS
jgi:hypothetical protein